MGDDNHGMFEDHEYVPAIHIFVLFLSLSGVIRAHNEVFTRLAGICVSARFTRLQLEETYMT